MFEIIKKKSNVFSVAGIRFNQINFICPHCFKQLTYTSCIGINCYRCGTSLGMHYRGHDNVEGRIEQYVNT